jgi:hypothetical protein
MKKFTIRLVINYIPNMGMFSYYSEKVYNFVSLQFQFQCLIIVVC